MREKKPILFLDFDGVLTNKKFLSEVGPVNRFTHYRGERCFCVNNVDKLNQITSATGAKIVVSSTWRKNMAVDELRTLLYHNYCTGDIIGATDDFPFLRGAEVLDWLLRHGEQERVGRFVILDDRLDFGFLQHNLCTVSEDLGLTQESVSRALEILSGADTKAYTFSDVVELYHRKPYPRPRLFRGIAAAVRVQGQKDAGLIRYGARYRGHVIQSARFAGHKHLEAMHLAVASKDYITLQSLLEIDAPEVHREFMDVHLERARSGSDTHLEQLLSEYKPKE